jgi:hypothetical protein
MMVQIRLSETSKHGLAAKKEAVCFEKSKQTAFL